MLLNLACPQAANLHSKLIRFVNDLNDKRDVKKEPLSDDEPNLSLWLVHFTCFTSNPKQPLTLRPQPLVCAQGDDDTVDLSHAHKKKVSVTKEIL